MNAFDNRPSSSHPETKPLSRGQKFHTSVQSAFLAGLIGAGATPEKTITLSHTRTGGWTSWSSRRAVRPLPSSVDQLRLRLQHALGRAQRNTASRKAIVREVSGRVGQAAPSATGRARGRAQVREVGEGWA